MIYVEFFPAYKHEKDTAIFCLLCVSINCTKRITVQYYKILISLVIHDAHTAWRPSKTIQKRKYQINEIYTMKIVEDNYS